MPSIIRKTEEKVSVTVKSDGNPQNSIKIGSLLAKIEPPHCIIEKADDKGELWVIKVARTKVKDLLLAIQKVNNIEVAND